jgi:uncharacterized protein YdeI (YjbR/CyaY-like superfamily)
MACQQAAIKGLAAPATVASFCGMTLTRKLNTMPAEIERALADRGLKKAYSERPDYQRNDYLGWIARARLPATKKKRLDQMLDELERGGVYMKMRWNG